MSERPGGSQRAHRRVRRQEEIIWIKAQQFTCVISLLSSPHNLHAYEEAGLTCEHYPVLSGAVGAGGLPAVDPGLLPGPKPVLAKLYAGITARLAADGRVLLHSDGLDDTVMGTVTGYMLASGRLADGSEAIAVVERMFQRQMGPVGRSLVAWSEAPGT
ncbi:MAG: hypothetical protein ACYDH5_10840 [Acidimicrobiales bacterium]